MRAADAHCADLPAECGALEAGQSLFGLPPWKDCSTAALDGCTLRDVPDVAACCVECSNNPLCGAYTFRANDNLCMLAGTGPHEQRDNTGCYTGIMARGSPPQAPPQSEGGDDSEDDGRRLVGESSDIGL